MSTPSHLIPLGAALGESPASSEARGLRWLLTTGAVLIVMVCVVEWRSGVISDWDRWLQPAIAALLLAYATALARWPQYTPCLRLAATLTFNAYLVFTVLVLLYALPGTLNQYQFMSTMYWLPLGYGTAFVFLRTHQALRVSLMVFALLFVPMGITLAVRGLAHWGDNFAPLVAVMAVAQVAYFVLFTAIATVRAGYHRAEERAQLMEALASTDALTGLPNRRAMAERLQTALAAAQRHGEAVSVAIVDVDHFKRINDHHGHASGDSVLVQIARRLAAQLRASDTVGRWGGEEFLALARHAPLQAATDLAERLRTSIATCTFDHLEPVTVSIGVAEFRSGDTADVLLARADRALYVAKRTGRNRVEVQTAAAEPALP